MGSIVAQRLEAIRRLTENPRDPVASNLIQAADSKVSFKKFDFTYEESYKEKCRVVRLNLKSLAVEKIKTVVAKYVEKNIPVFASFTFVILATFSP